MLQTSTRSAQAQQSLANDSGAGDWPSQTSRPRLGQSPHRPCGGLVACSRGSPRRRNASKIGTVLTDKKIFVWTWQITLQPRPAHCSLVSPEISDTP